jgi:excisionase family DNA binding protein
MDAKQQAGWRSISDAQKHLPASRSSYYEMIADGRLKSIRIGGSRYISMDSLEQLIRKADSKKLPQRISQEMRARGLASARARKVSP